MTLSGLDRFWQVDMARLNGKQLQAIGALLAGSNIKESAETAGVSERTLRRWLNDNPAFRAALAEAEGQALGAISRRLLSLANEALTVLAGVMAAKSEITPAIKLRAAQITLSNLLPVRELVDFEERLERLEALYESRNSETTHLVGGNGTAAGAPAQLHGQRN